MKHRLLNNGYTFIQNKALNVISIKNTFKKVLFEIVGIWKERKPQGLIAGFTNV